MSFLFCPFLKVYARLIIKELSALIVISYFILLNQAMSLPPTLEHEEILSYSPPIHLQAPKKNILPPWNKYPVEVKDPQFKFFLMRVAPGAIPPAEKPYREALINTLLLFQHQINVGWVDEDTPEMQTLRRDFFYTYLKNINWEATRFKRFFLTPEEDFHLINVEAFIYAYDFPETIGIQTLYRTPDFIDPFH